MDSARASLVPGSGDAGFAGEPGLQQLASAACHRILRLFGVSGAAVLLAGGAHPQVIAQAGDVATNPMALPAVRGLIDRALSLGRAGRTEAHNAVDAHAIVTPLRRDGVPVGVILMWRPSAHSFTDTELAQSALSAESLGMTLQLHHVGETLRRSEAQYRLLFQRNPLPMYVSTFEERRIIAVNPAAIQLYGYDEARFLQLHSADLMFEQSAEERARVMRETAPYHRIQGLVGQHRTATGRTLDVEVWTDEIEFEGRNARLVLVYDITERCNAERELARVSRVQRMLSACNEALVRSQDEPDLLARVSDIALNIGGYRFAMVCMACDDEGRSIRIVDWPGQPPNHLRELRVSWAPDGPCGQGPMGRVIRSGEPVVMDDLAQHRDELVMADASLNLGYRSLVVLPLRDAGQTFGVLNLLGGEVQSVMGRSELALLMELADNLAYGIVHQRARQQRRLDAARIAQLAYSDELTGLPNRARLSEQLQNRIDDTRAHGGWSSLLLLDIHNLKALNEIWGHQEGDRLLRSFAQRLQLATAGVCARLGADEFVVLLGPHRAGDETIAVDEATGAASRLLQALAYTHHSEGWVFECLCSAGLVLFNGHDGGVSELLQRAEIALYAAKAAGPQSLRRYDRELHAAVVEHAQLDQALREALNQRQFELHYQPQCDVNGTWVGAEALVRWRHPQRGWVSPGTFIPACEESGLILRLGLQVLEMACARLAQWQAMPHLAGLMLSVNVSARQFRQPEFVRQVAQALAASGAPARKLKLELTESVMVDDVEQVTGKMKALRELGVSFSLDDFGTGYSSLSQLQRLPLDQIKIDQSFVRDLLTSPNDASIARTVIALGQSLGLDVVAEGVETAAQRDFLHQHGCRTFQGYFFSRPLPQAQFEEGVPALADPPRALQRLS
ncbi:EAL domain-containing protein [Hydrogenophaga atypica]|uniref:EAL domain-containing protein n=1 Tax=Hydrogenophaga atypica TaxID=249409 RepID=A0ABW2QUY3_9BURK